MSEVEETEEDYSGLEETDRETEESEEDSGSSESEVQEDNNDWYGIIET